MCEHKEMIMCEGICMKKKIMMLSSIVYAVVVFYILYINVIYEGTTIDWMYHDFDVPCVWLIILAIGVWLLLLLLHGKREKVVRKEDSYTHFKFTLFFLTLILLGLQILIVWGAFINLGWDVSTIKIAAIGFLESGQMDYPSRLYFALNPNNIVILDITIGFLKLGQICHIDGYKVMVICDIALNNMAVLFSALCVYKVTKKQRLAYCVYGVAALLFGLLPWMTVPYTDMFSILFPILSLYIYIYVRKTTMPNILKVLLIVLLPSLGYLMKPSNLFILFAIFICEAVNVLQKIIQREKGGKQLFYLVVGVFISFFIVIVGKTVSYQVINYTESNMKKPIEQFLLLGANVETVGQWNEADESFFTAIVDRDEKRKMIAEAVMRRYQEMGVSGWFEHLSKKTYLNYSSGIFGWEGQGGFAEHIGEKTIKLKQFICNIFYPSCGKYFSGYATFMQFVWYFIMIGGGIGAGKNIYEIIQGKRKSSDVGLIVEITLIGMFVFLLFFETNARYLISFLPLFAILPFVLLNGNNITE